MDPSQWAVELQDNISAITAWITLAVNYGIPCMIFLVAYCFQSAALTTIARRRGLPSPWLAWLPIGNLWIMGSLSDHYRQTVYEQVKNKRVTLLLLSLAALAAAALAGTGIAFAATGKLQTMFPELSPMAAAGGIMILCLLAMALLVYLRVIEYAVVFDLYRSCDPGRAVVLLIVSIAAYMLQPFLIFSLRRKDGGMPLRRNPQTYYTQPRCEF